MLQNFKENQSFYYLLEVNEVEGKLYANPLAKMWSTNAFTTVSDVSSAYKFEDKITALKMANIQNMLNEGFNSNFKVYAVEAQTNNTIFDAEGKVKSLDTFTIEETDSLDL
ncbi:hypothetical protein [Staphylococcus agnetis]|uniref:hypothetical protein n=1 Tax=Staphylococcus agnetis TaxID=985762 RepID=UPI000722EA0C|nr:hypothetical protein [Staphylococcus agnetis]ALN76070.1 hypothetical protein EP23_01225 [Staphylococcus agnetis]